MYKSTITASVSDIPTAVSGISTIGADVVIWVSLCT